MANDAGIKKWLPSKAQIQSTRRKALLQDEVKGITEHPLVELRNMECGASENYLVN